MRVFITISVLAALFFAFHQASSGRVTPMDVSLEPRKIQGLPSNVNGDFWDAYDPPSTKANQSEAIHFEFLHCDRGFDSKKARAGGNCHYLAGSVARYSELHLTIRGTASIVGTCGLAANLRLNKGTIMNHWRNTIERQKLRNGLCFYDTYEETQYLKITN